MVYHINNGFLAEIEECYMPWLMKEVSNEMESMVSSRDILTGITINLCEI